MIMVRYMYNVVKTKMCRYLLDEANCTCTLLKMGHAKCHPLFKQCIAAMSGHNNYR